MDRSALVLLANNKSIVVPIPCWTSQFKPLSEWKAFANDSFNHRNLTSFMKIMIKCETILPSIERNAKIARLGYHCPPRQKVVIYTAQWLPRLSF